MTEAKETIRSIRERIADFERAMKVEEVAALFNVDKDTVYKRAKIGDIPSFRVGTSVRFDPKQLADWHKKHSIG